MHLFSKAEKTGIKREYLCKKTHKAKAIESISTELENLPEMNPKDLTEINVL